MKNKPDPPDDASEPGRMEDRPHPAGASPSRQPQSDGYSSESANMDAFVSLFAAHQRTIFLYLTSLLPTSTDVDDVFQETSLTLWREFHRFEIGTNFGAWACTIAFNRVRAWRTKRSRESLVFSEAFLRTISEELIERSSYYEDRVDALSRCMEKLPEHHQQLLRHRYTDRMSIDHIAATVSRTTDAVYRMLSRIRNTLHGCVTRSLSSGETL